MTREAYVKAEDIYKKIDNFRKLSRLANEPYKRFRLQKKFLLMSNYDKTEAVLCDKGLAMLIEEYCNKRINELQEKLKAL